MDKNMCKCGEFTLDSEEEKEESICIICKNNHFRY